MILDILGAKSHHPLACAYISAARRFAYAYANSRAHACHRVHVSTKDERDSVGTNSSLFARVDRRDGKLRVTAV